MTEWEYYLSKVFQDGRYKMEGDMAHRGREI